MAGRGPQSYQKRQKEMQRKEKQQEKMAKRLQRKQNKEAGIPDEPETGDLDSGAITSDTGEESLQGV